MLLDVVLNCGGDLALRMNEMIPKFTSFIVTMIKVGVPILLVFFGMLDLGKAVMAQKEDEIKKGQQMFVKRLITAVLVYLVIFLVQVVFNLIANDDAEGSMWNCVNCMIDYSEENCPSE